MKFKILQLYRRYDEYLFFTIYLGAILALSPILSRIIGDAWATSQVIQPLTRLGVLAGLSPHLGVLLIFGFIIGLLVLMTIDSKKRWSALLLWIGFTTVSYQLFAAGQVLPSNITDPDQLVWIGSGALVGIFIGGGVDALRLRSLGPNEFRRAVKLTYLSLIGILVLALGELHLMYPDFLAVSADSLVIEQADLSVGVDTDGLPVNLAVGLATIVTVRQFIGYDADEGFFILGAPGSGKSLLLVGAYLEALERDADKSIRRRESLDPSQDLMELAENLDRDNSEWIVEATGRSEFRDLKFKYVRGNLFPKNVTLGSVDYAGEHLRRIPEALAGEIENPDEELQLLTSGIQAADTLILLIDIERYVNRDGLSIAEYFKILEEAENKGVVVVATKCDILADQFIEDEEMDPEQNFGAFQQYVQDHLTNSEQFRTLLRQTPESEVYPVYYKTEFNDDGERVPVRDENGSVVTVGFDHLLNGLGK